MGRCYVNGIGGWTFTAVDLLDIVFRCMPIEAGQVHRFPTSDMGWSFMRASDSAKSY